MAIGPTRSSMVWTRAGDVRVESGGTGSTDLVAVTPVGSRWLVEALPAPLAELCRVHVVELPGTGGSSGEGRAQTVATTIEAIGDVAAALGGSDCILFGHSMNGTLALAASASVPCRGVIAVGAPPTLPPDLPAIAAFWDQNADPVRKQRAADLIAAHEATDDEALRAQARERYSELRQWYDFDVDRSGLDELLKLDRVAAWAEAIFADAATFRWQDTMRLIPSPVLLVSGEQDFMSPPTAWRDSQDMANATIVLIEGAAHNPFVEQPEVFMAAVHRWLAGAAEAASDEAPAQTGGGG